MIRTALYTVDMGPNDIVTFKRDINCTVTSCCADNYDVGSVDVE